MLDLRSGVADGAHGWVTGRAGLWGVPPTWVWVVGFSLQILKHPTSICDTGVNIIIVNYWYVFLLINKDIIIIMIIIIVYSVQIALYSHEFSFFC